MARIELKGGKMMDITQMQGAITAIGAVRDLLKVGIDAKVDAKAAEKVIEAMGKLGDATDALYSVREELFRLQAENVELSRQLTEDKEWKDKLSRYELTKTVGGAVVYKSISEPEHYICPNCVNQKRLEILQDERSFSGTYRCTSTLCRAEFPVMPSQSMGVLERRASPYR